MTKNPNSKKWHLFLAETVDAETPHSKYVIYGAKDVGVKYAPDFDKSQVDVNKVHPLVAYLYATERCSTEPNPMCAQEVLHTNFYILALLAKWFRLSPIRKLSAEQKAVCVRSTLYVRKEMSKPLPEKTIRVPVPTPDEIRCAGGMQ